ncbi:glycerate kinase [Enterococcus sp. DIV0756]|uniref:glycerate kinase n=1 Tax=Enterococcus sp. DIV0756 TaxID=2774636 RepID=UPI003F20445A
MKYLIAIDSFKGSLTSNELNQSVASGIKKIDSTAEIVSFAVADGGEGTAAAFYQNGLGERKSICAKNLYLTEITANFVLLNQETVVLEVAETAGIHFLSDDKPETAATSYGVGVMLRNILTEYPQVKRVIIGLGGSGINDAGIGMMQALGVQFKKSNGDEIAFGTSEIHTISQIDDTNLIPEIKEKEIILLSDVKNQLTGPTGATMIFGKQKGISDLERLDKNIAHYGEKLKETYGVDYVTVPSTGAAGGIGISFLYFLNAQFISGAEYIIDILGLEKKLAEIDLVITGEGKMDRQSAFGKLPTIVARLAKKYRKKVFAVVGDGSEVTSENYAVGIDLVLSLPRGPLSLEESMRNTNFLAEEIGRDIGRIVHLLER